MLAQVNYTAEPFQELYDLNRPLTHDCTVSAVDFDQDAFWHSSAHILGYAIELTYPDAQLAHGPPTDSGFFYDFGTQAKVTETDYASLESHIQKIIK